jgi:Fe-S cluster biogenesis protein NfuA
MIDSDEVVAGLAPVQEMIRLDGGDIVLVDVEESTAHLRLVVEGANCAECVLPRSLLEGVALQMMQPLVPGLTAVAIDDPRES